MIKKIWLLLLLLVGFHASGQYFSTGEDPASIRWRQISTLHFQLVYPEGFENNAQKLANYFEKVYQSGGNTLNHRPGKIPVLFHTSTVQSNGMVAWAPRRMELYTTPHQAIYGQDWLEQLAIHEFRHVVQIDKIHSRLPGFLRVVFGEHIGALVTGGYLPFWYLEGDAVVTETALSRFGRGRLPSFLMEHRAQVIEKGVFSLDKAFNGSYKHFVPDHYKLGYHLVGEARTRYGSDLWEKALGRVGRKPWSLTPFNKTIRMETGLTLVSLYRSVFDSLKVAWKEEDLKFHPMAMDTIQKQDIIYTNYTHNHVLPSGDIISLKTGYDIIPRFVKINSDGTEKVVTVPGLIFGESVGYRNNLIVWTEQIPDVRWTHSGRSRIFIFNSENNEKRTFFPEFKAFAPAISPDEQYVAVVEVNFTNDYYLSIYNAFTGALIKRFQSEDNNFFFNPVWIDENHLAAIVLTTDGKKIARVNPFISTMEVLEDLGGSEIKHLTYQNGYLYFVSGYSGRDEVWQLSLKDKSMIKLSRARFGHAYPVPSDKKIIVSDYTSNGYQLVALVADSSDKLSGKMDNRVEFRLAEILATQENGIIDFRNADTIRYNSTPYKKASNLFNFHSRAPFVLDVNSYGINPGVNFISQNLLGTAETSVGYKWNSAESNGRYFVNFDYKGWYPIVNLKAGTGKRTSEYNEIQIVKNQQGQIIRQDTVRKFFSWTESDFSFGARVPLNFSRGAWSRMFQPEVSYKVTKYTHNAGTPAAFINGNMHTVAGRLYFHQIRRKAVRDVLPDFGWITDVSYRETPFGDNNAGALVAAQIRLYLPGFSRNHGTTLYAGTQQRNRGEKYAFSDVISMPRGWHPKNNNQLSAISLEYRLPLFYPEFSLGRYIYFKRIKASVFGDFAALSGDTFHDGKVVGQFSKNISSVGVDLTSDINLLRLYAPADAGVRTIYLPGEGKFRFEFLFSIDFTSFGAL